MGPLLFGLSGTDVPIAGKIPSEAAEIVSLAGLAEEGIGAQLLALLDGGMGVEAGEDHDQYFLELRPGTNPFEDLPAVCAREPQVQEDGERQGKECAIGIWPVAQEVVDGVVAVLKANNLIGNVGKLQSALKKKNVVVRVFDQKNDFGGWLGSCSVRWIGQIV